MQLTSRKNKKRGYTIIELSVTISIIAVLASAGLTIFTKQQDKTKRDKTLERISIIENSLKKFTDINGHLPCPANPSATEESNDFGYMSNYDFGTKECTATGNATGTIPSRSLNLPDEFTYDGWGRKFSYRIAKGMGAIGDFGNLSNKCDISIIDVNGDEKTNINMPAPNNQGAAYVIISYGPRGYGAWGASGAIPQLPPESSKEFENSNHSTNKIYVQDSPTYIFNNIVSFKDRRSLVELKQALSPMKIPTNVCNDAQIILNSNNLTNVEPVDLRDQIKASSNAILELCKNPPLATPETICSFTPASIKPDSLFTWLDASNVANNGILPADNSSIATIIDRSGKNNHATNSGTQALFKSSSTPFANNLPAIYFNGSSNSYTISGNLNNTTYTIFVVEALAASNTASHYVLGNKTNAPTSGKCLHLGYYFDSNSKYYQQFGHYENNIATSANLNLSTVPSLLIAELSSTGKILDFQRSDNSANKILNSDPSFLSSYAGAAINIGGGICGNNTFYQGFVGEIIIYNTELSSSEVQEIKSYLLRKWFSGECAISS